MKTIKLTESQLSMLIESSNEAPSFNGGDVQEYTSEIYPNSVVTTQDGDKEYGEPINSDDIQSDMTNQHGFANSNLGIRGTR